MSRKFWILSSVVAFLVFFAVLLVTVSKVYAGLYEAVYAHTNCETSEGIAAEKHGSLNENLVSDYGVFNECVTEKDHALTVHEGELDSCVTGAYGACYHLLQAEYAYNLMADSHDNGECCAVTGVQLHQEAQAHFDAQQYDDAETDWNTAASLFADAASYFQSAWVHDGTFHQEIGEFHGDMDQHYQYHSICEWPDCTYGR